MKNWIKVFVLLSLCGLLVYFNSLNNKFIIDDYYFINNPVLSSTKFISSQWNPYREQALGVLDSHESLKYYRPTTHILYDFCYATFKNNYWQYHLLNLFLFVLASSLIYLLIEKVTGIHSLALLAALFYLIHPINGIVVNYISASVFTLQVIFMIGTVLLLWESLERKNNRTLYFLSLLFSFLSLFWHESGVMIPFYIFSFILLFRKDALRTKISYSFPYFLIVIFYIVFRHFFLGANENVLKQIALAHMTAGEYLAGLFQVFSWYIGKLFYPQGIVMQWATPILHDHIILKVCGLFLLFMFFVLLLVRFAREKTVQWAVVWILIGFAPVFLAAYMRSYNCAVIEPHWFIFSSIGFFILTASFCSFILNRWKNAGLVLLFILIFSWGAVSHAYNRFWADQKTYALYWSQQNPDLRSTYFYLGYAYMNEGDLKESKKYYQLALTGFRSDEEIYINLGAIDQSEGRYKEAESNYRMALKIYPFSAGAYYNLGYLDFAQGRFNKATQNFERSLMLNPLLLEPRRGLALICFKNFEYQKAIGLCLTNLDIVNDDPDTLLLLVSIFIKKKDVVNLKKYAYRIINSETDPKSLTKIGVLMEQNKAPIIALDCFEKALRVDPDYSDAYLATGTLFMNMGKYDEAIHIWKIGSGIAPSDQRFKKDIIKALSYL